MYEWLPRGTTTPTGVRVTLSFDRWRHIVRRHPEMAPRGPDLLETLAGPDVILEGDRGARMAVRRLETGPFAHKQLVVVYRQQSEEDGFVVTAYVARRLKAGRRIVWQR